MATNVDSKPPIHDLFSIPDTDHKWFDIGLALGLDASTLQNVKGANDLKRKREMFRKVLEAKPSLTWREMLLTLKSVGLEESAKRTCDCFEWPVSVLDEPLSTGRSLSVTEYYSGDVTSYQILESLKPPQYEETTATASMRSASDSLPAVDTDSDIYHSAPSAGDDIYGIPFTPKAATTNFGPPSSSSGGYHSSKSTRPRTELMAGLGSSVKSFWSDLLEAQPVQPLVITGKRKREDNDIPDVIKKQCAVQISAAQEPAFILARSCSLTPQTSKMNEVLATATLTQLSQECSHEALLQLSAKICGYDRYKYMLGLSDAEIENIDKDSQFISSVPGKFYATLKKWKSKSIDVNNPSESTATYSRLIEIATNIKDGEAIRSIHKACVKHTSSARASGVKQQEDEQAHGASGTWQ